MNSDPSDANTKAGACAYILLMLLQRLEAERAGLIDELIKGALADQTAIERNGSMTEAVAEIFAAAQKLLQQANDHQDPATRSESPLP